MDSVLDAGNAGNSGISTVPLSFRQQMPVTAQVGSEMSAAAARVMSVFGTMTTKLLCPRAKVKRTYEVSGRSDLRHATLRESQEQRSHFFWRVWKSTCSLREPVSSRTFGRSRVTLMEQGAFAIVSFVARRQTVGKAETRNGFSVFTCLWHEASTFSLCKFCTGAINIRIAAEPREVDSELKYWESSQ